MIKVTHITSVHSRNDVRIFLKECCSLVENGYDVSLVVADGKGDATVSGVKIYDVGPSGGRISRMMKTTKKVYAKALSLDSDIYHFHDPELLKSGLKLLNAGKKVVYDSHEDVAADIVDKEYIPKLLRGTIARRFEKKEKAGAKKLSAVVAATPFIRDRFKPFNGLSVDINNYPLDSEYEINESDVIRVNQVCYIGGITKVRCVDVMVKSMSLVNDVSLEMAGNFESEEFRNEMAQVAGWDKVNHLGFINRKEGTNLKLRSIAGLVIFSPIANHVDSQPNKLFEYMSAGLPIIGSNFDAWKEIIEVNNCGICVDPSSPEEVAEAIDRLKTSPKLVKELGDNGKRLVVEKFNWNIEKKKLFNLYEKLMA